MAKKSKVDFDKEAGRLFKSTEQYADRVRRYYASAVEELLKLAKSRRLNADGTFSFADNRRLSDKATKILRQLYSAVYGEIKGGVAAEWKNANLIHDRLIEQIFGKGVLTDNHFAEYFAHNSRAVDAFFRRKSADGGLNLSQKVWKYVGNLKTEMEVALSVAIGEGKSADSMSRDVRKYLQNPDVMFRRFRVKTGEREDGSPVYGRIWKRKVVDPETGEVHWENFNPKDYKSGRGVYRSSYKNAMRLTRTETNIAYRTAEQDRWSRLDFVLGYRVVRSDNHPRVDICDCLSCRRGEVGSQGTYPKDFQFKGWHPQCRCYAVPILSSDEDYKAWQRAVALGEEPPKPKGVVTEPNEDFKKWVKDNGERIAQASTLPYWYKDNKQYIKPAQKSEVNEVGVAPKYGSNYQGTKLGRAANKEAYREYMNSAPPTLSDAQKENIDSIAKEMGITAKPMTFMEADSGMANVNMSQGGVYRENCQSCVAVHEARLRGLNITALGYSNDTSSPTYRLGEKSQIIWRNAKGKIPEPTIIKGQDWITKADRQMSAQGRYHIGINFNHTSNIPVIDQGKVIKKISDDGHIIVAERMSNGKIFFFDPQCNEFVNLNSYEEVESVEIIRVDKLLIDGKLLKEISHSL